MGVAKEYEPWDTSMLDLSCHIPGEFKVFSG